MFPHWWPDNNNTDDPSNKNRAFARSDDGGATWSELWYLADRQPQIQRFTAECAHAFVSDPQAGTLYWGHPGGPPDGHNRANYTMQRSVDGGASWEHLIQVGKPSGGAGYSDAHLLEDGTLGVVYQKTFDPPVRSIEGGGYDLALAIISGL